MRSAARPARAAGPKPRAPEARRGDRYADALRIIVEAASTGDRAKYRAAAVALDGATAAGELCGDEFYATVCSALCCDIAGRRGDAVRMYRLLEQRYSGELEYIVRSPARALRLVRGMASLGMGDGGRLLSAAVEDAGEWILAQAAPGGLVEHDTPDDYNVFMATVVPLCRFYEALKSPDSDGKAGELAKRAGSIYDELLHYYPDPPLGFMASLYLRLIEAMYERSPAGLDAAACTAGAAANPGMCRGGRSSK